MNAERLQALLQECVDRHNVPGASVAVLHGEELTLAAAGVVSRNTGVRVTTDTIFQIGSVTKVYTATQVMQLVDQGKVDLDSPVRNYLPSFTLADEAATREVTVRQLLCHTSGVGGDHTVDMGRGDDCIARYVDSLASVPLVAPPGELFSYSNAGYTVAAALVAEVTGRTWDTALKEHIFEPLCNEHSVTLPEEAILYRAAVGHVGASDTAEEAPTKMWMMPRTGGRAGIVSSASDVLTFVALHLNQGIGTATGARLLSEQSVQDMQTLQVELPDKSMGLGWGLGWTLGEWDGRAVIGHDGETIGQIAFLRVVPSAGFAMTLLTNGLSGGALYRELFSEVLHERLGLAMPEPSPPVEEIDFDPSLLVGTYERESFRTRIWLEDGQLLVSVTVDGLLADIVRSLDRGVLRPVDEGRFLLNRNGMNVSVVFCDLDERGRPRYMHSGGRASRRID